LKRDGCEQSPGGRLLFTVHESPYHSPPTVCELDSSNRKSILWAPLPDGGNHGKFCDASSIHAARNRENQGKPSTTGRRKKDRREGWRKDSYMVLDHGPV